MAQEREKRYQKRKQIQKELNDKNIAQTQKAQNVSKQQDQETIRKLREELRSVRMRLHDIKDKEYEKKQEKLSRLETQIWLIQTQITLLKKNWIILHFHQPQLLPIILEKLWILQKELMREILQRSRIQAV
eukprot:530673_1